MRQEQVELLVENGGDLLNIGGNKKQRRKKKTVKQKKLRKVIKNYGFYAKKA